MLTGAALGARIDRDLHLTRTLLDRLPDSSMTWQPHPRSFTLGGLGTHLAQLPHWGLQILNRDHHDLSTGGRRRDALATRADILAMFDRHATAWHHALVSTSDATLEAPWQLRWHEAVLESMSRAQAVDRYLLHHLIHHRGQLTVYLRLLDVPLTPLYGPTADPHP